MTKYIKNNHRAGAKIPVRYTVPLYTRNGLFTRCTKMCIPGMDVKTGCTVSVHPVWRICPCLHCERPLCHPGVAVIMRNPDDTSTKIPSIPGVPHINIQDGSRVAWWSCFCSKFLLILEELLLDHG